MTRAWRLLMHNIHYQLALFLGMLPLQNVQDYQLPVTVDTQTPITVPASPTADGEIASCPVCGVTYYHRRTLREHMKRHSGETRCPVCYQEFGMKNSVRRHMVIKHGMSKEAVDRLTNRRLRTMEYMARFAEGQEAATEPAPPYTGYGAPSQRDAF